MKRRIDQHFESPSKRAKVFGDVNSKLVGQAIEFEEENEIKWSDSQWNIIHQVDQKKNVFFTGNAGTGKSTLLHFFKQAFPTDVLQVTATTGLAACHIGGTTIHSFVGAGLAKGTVESCVKYIRRFKPSVMRWKKTRILVIDEISMMSGLFFDKINAIAKQIRGNEYPFGGIQLIITGDFLQLPPIPHRQEGFAFQASCWNDVVDVVCVLKTIFRQSDDTFVQLLNEVRIGKISQENVVILQERLNQKEPDLSTVVETKLFSLKNEVERYNDRHLQLLDQTTEQYFNAEDWCEHKSFQSTLNAGQAREILKLRKGAHVMLIWNLDLDAGLCNGAQGIVDDFQLGPESGTICPVVQFQNGVVRTIEPLMWKIEREGKTIAKRQQIPLILAWALTIHKSQGMTLDRASISLKSVFEYGQAYVALSRVRSLEGLRLISFDPKKINAHAAARQFYEKLQL